MSLLNKLAGFWTFEEAASPSSDVSGRGNDLTWHNDVTRVPGVLNYGIHFDGTEDYVSTAITSDLAMGASEAFTIAGWWKPEFGASRSFMALAGHIYNYRLGMTQYGSYYRFQLDVWHDGGTLVTVQSALYALGDWFFIRAWRDPDNSVLGIQVNCDTIVTTPFSAAFLVDQQVYDFYIGGGPAAGPFEVYYGAADAVGIWKTVHDSGEAAMLCAGTEYPFGLCLSLIYGDYEFSPTWYPAEDGLEWSPAVTPLARAHGGRAIDFYLKPRRLLVKGGEIKGPFDSSDLHTRIDAILAALGAQPQELTFVPEWYWRDVRVEYFRNPYGPTHYCRIAADMEISFLARDPFQYARLGSSDTWSAPTNAATHTIDVGGAVLARPSFAFTVGGVGAQTISWVLTNNTTGEAFTLAGDVTGGQVIHVDCLDQTVLIGTTDEIALFDGEFMGLDVGTNTLAITITTGSITSIVTTWRNRKW